MKINWTEEQILSQLKESVSDFGYFPTAKELREVRSDLVSAIYRSNKSLADYRDLLGFEPQNKPKGYWRVWANLERELKARFPEMIGSGVCPNSATMKQAGISSEVFNKSLYGGLVGIAYKLNCRLLSGYFSRDKHFLLSTYELIFDEYLYSIGLNHSPNGYLSNEYRYKYDQKVGNIYFEILGYDQNSESSRSIPYRQNWKIKKKIYSDLGLNLVILERSFFRGSYKDITLNLDNLISNLGFATDRIYSFDISEIMSSCRDITHKDILDMINEVAVKLNKIPSANDLIRLGRYDLLNRIRITGGFRKYKNG